MKTLKEFNEGLGPRVGGTVGHAAHKLWQALRSNPEREKEIMDHFKKELKSLGYKGKI